MFRDMLTWMNVGGTSQLVGDKMTPTNIAPPVPPNLQKALAG
jgi:hypothetical protein